ncbi:MAG: amidohydrolase family protein [Phycisphaerales bacterium]
MIVDLETHVWSSPTDLGLNPSELSGRGDLAPWHSFDASAQAHQQAMGCVDVAIVLGFRSRLLDARISAETVASFVSKAPTRRLGFVGIDPMEGDAIAAIDHAVNLGLVGVTVSPAAQSFHPLHSRAMRMYERCEELGLPVLVTENHLFAPAAALDHARPTPFDEVARAFPKLKLVLGRLGFPWIDETLVLAMKHRNIYTDLSGVIARPWRLYNALLAAFELGVTDKILFASNFPQETPEAAIERIYSLNSYSHGTNLPAIPRQQLRSIVERDSLNCLGLARPGVTGQGLDRDAAWSGDAERGERDSSLVNTLTELMSGGDAGDEE